jgi:uncharacterized protein YkwD
MSPKRLALLFLLPILTACSPEVMQVVGAVLTDAPASASTLPSPAPTPAATPTPSAGPVSAEVQQVLDLVNVERGKVGVKALVLSDALNRVAAFRSNDMVKRNYFAHQDPDGHSPFYWLETNGINYMAAGENIAMGQDTPTEVMDAWMHSDGHRANILKSSFGRLGVGLAKNAKGQLYWTQLFTN